jgi:hypothetical protein
MTIVLAVVLVLLGLIIVVGLIGVRRERNRPTIDWSTEPGGPAGGTTERASHPAAGLGGPGPGG